MLDRLVKLVVLTPAVQLAETWRTFSMPSWTRISALPRPYCLYNENLKPSSSDLLLFDGTPISESRMPSGILHFRMKEAQPAALLRSLFSLGLSKRFLPSRLGTVFATSRTVKLLKGRLD